jgi:hypothetical protein
MVRYIIEVRKFDDENFLSCEGAELREEWGFEGLPGALRCYVGDNVNVRWNKESREPSIIFEVENEDDALVVLSVIDRYFSMNKILGAGYRK